MGGPNAQKHNAILINLLELLAMIITAYVMVVQISDLSNIEGASVVTLGDNVSAVTWVNISAGEHVTRERRF